ncbi:MAG: DNA polymerase/3'-5' exonuclease PolX [Patescibacteria group bacterium]|nr:DNA polymerase/3'-5' exonuclease PolX [Patescibacteria group bacterium]
MLNEKIADIFDEIADMYAMENIQFKPRAYQKAAISLRSLNRDVKDIYKEGGLKALNEISGIGESMALKIEEIIKTGRIKEYKKMKKKMPAKVEEMTVIEGVGPKLVKKVYEKLGIKTVKQLEEAAEKGKISKLKGMGEKTEENILSGIKFLEKNKGRKLLGYILPEALDIKQDLINFTNDKNIELVGSIRRGKETIGDIDLLAVSNNSKKLIDAFCSLRQVEKIYARGADKALVRLKSGFDCDLRVFKKESYGAGLLYFTGSKLHNIKLRKMAMAKGLSLNEYGLYKVKSQNLKVKSDKLKVKSNETKTKIAGETEKEIYQKFGMDYIEPELREDRGEIEASLSHKLPKLVDRKDILGVFHVHSDFSLDAVGSISDLVKKCQKMGLKYLVMGDHVGSLKIAAKMEGKDILDYIKYIESLNKKISDFRILSGVEANILRDGTIDVPDNILAKLDVVVAGIHSVFKMSKKEMTERLCKAMKNKHIDIISHPTGKLLGRRDEYELDVEQVIKIAKETKTCLEINAFPDRLDLNDINIKSAIEHGVKLAIGLDSHSVDQLDVLDFGILTSRRGWAEKKDIINTYSVDKLFDFLKKK